MPRIHLRIYVEPGEAEITFNIQLHDQSYERVTGTIDTGAEVSLLPSYLLNKISNIAHDERETFVVDQAGIANQSFSAVRANVTLFLEDQYGNRTRAFDVPVWFADTEIALIGFKGILDQAVLHLDMPKHEGWLEIDV